MGRSSPRLDPKAIRRCVQILDQWGGKLTWSLYRSRIKREFNVPYSKSALCTKRRIADAFALAKARIRASVKGVGHGDVGITLNENRVKHLSAENERLEKENEVLLQQFVRWAFNASRKGLSLSDLDAPIPVIPAPAHKKIPRI